MTTSDSVRGLCGPGRRAFTAKRREAGTTLVEILVVIVIFLIGILAVVQVFPRGFRLLLITKNNSMATALGRDEVERMKSNPEGVPEQVLPVVYVAGVPRTDPTLNPLALGPQGDRISSAGRLTRSGSTVSENWMLAAGPNVARRIVGEGARVPAPRTVGADYGGLMVLEHGPIDRNAPVVAYANDLSRNSGAPRDAADDGAYVPFDSSKSVKMRKPGVTNPSGDLGSVPARFVATRFTTAPYEYFVVNAATANASILIPTSKYDRTYRLRLSGYAGPNTGPYPRNDWISLSLFVPAKALDGATPHPLLQVRLADALSAAGQLSGKTFVGVEVDTVRLAPQYVTPAISGGVAQWSGDAFEAMLMDPNVGTILFSPAAREGVVTRPGGASEPLIAKVDYDVYDWRILREDFRAGEGVLQLSLQSLKVGTQGGPDGLKNGGLWANDVTLDPQGATDNVMVLDLTTGGRVVEDPRWFRVDKSRGVLTFPGGKVDIEVPQGDGIGTRTLSQVDMSQRTIRVLYKARNEWSVQVLKNASQYALVRALPDATSFVGQFYVGDGTGGFVATRLYFPLGDVDRKVTIDRIVYQTPTGTRTLEGQDFVLRRPRTGPTYAYADLTEVDPTATGFVTALPSGAIDPVQGVKAASVAVRVLWNPDAFQLTTDAATNMTRVDQWGRSWRRSLTETYLRAEETR